MDRDDRGERQFCVRPFAGFAIDRDRCVLQVATDLGICGAPVLDALEALDGCRTLARHAETLSRRRSVPPDEASRVVAMLQAAGLLREGLDCSALNTGQQVLSRGITVAIPTADRPLHLERCLASVAADIETIDAQAAIRVIVVDGSRRPANARLNRKHARDVLGARTTYVHPPSDVGLRLWCARAGWRDGLADRMLLSGDTGANRNVILLMSAGDTTVMVDDDVILSTWRPPTASGRVRISGHEDCLATEFYRTLEDACSAVTGSNGGCVAEHNSILGRRLGDAIVAGSQVAEDVCSHMIGGNRYGPWRVRISCAGVAGDSGVGCHDSFLFANPASAAVCGSSPLNSQVWRLRNVRRVAPQMTLTHDASLMTYCTGFANGELLPPFFPIRRGEDTLFGKVLRICEPGSLTAHLPLGVIHNSGRSPLLDGEWPSARQATLVEVLQGFLNRFQGPLSSSISDSMVCLGRLLKGLGAMPETAMREAAWTVVAQGRAAQLRSCADIAQGDCHPAEWRSDANKFADILSESIQSDVFLAVDIDELALTLLHYAEALELWPSAWSSARSGPLIFDTPNS